MRSFKKAVLPVLVCVALMVVVSMGLTAFNPHYRIRARQEQAGKTDFLVIGASNTEYAFVPQILDEILGCNSYNYAISGMKTIDKKLVLDTELARNPVKTVVMGLNCNTMEQARVQLAADANFHVYDVLETPAQRLEFLLTGVPLNNLPYVYSKSVLAGILGLVSHTNPEAERIERKGFYAREDCDFSLTMEQAAQAYHSIPFTTQDYYADTIADTDEIIEMCRQKGIRVICVTLPCAESYLIQYDDMDEFHSWAVDYCTSRNVEYYDFNLYKGRFDCFTDEESFSTFADHMSYKGAAAFTELLAQTLADSGKTEFYDSYAQMYRDCRYWGTIK